MREDQRRADAEARRRDRELWAQIDILKPQSVTPVSRTGDGRSPLVDLTQGLSGSRQIPAELITRLDLATVPSDGRITPRGLGYLTPDSWQPANCIGTQTGDEASTSRRGPMDVDTTLDTSRTLEEAIEQAFTAVVAASEDEPLIIKAWSEDCSLAKEKVNKVPIWSKLCGLPLKFWGSSSLEKISSLIGKFVRCDEPTMDKTRLGYARVMVEVDVGQSFPEKIYFKDEKGKDICVLVEYDWKPDLCTLCKGIGHITGACKKKIETKAKPQLRQEWRLVQRGQTIVPTAVAHVAVLRAQSVTKPMGDPVSGVRISRPGSPILSPVTVVSSMVRQEYQSSPSVGEPGSPTYDEVLISPKKHNKVGLYGLLETKVKDLDCTGILSGFGLHWRGVNNNQYHSGGRVWLVWVDQVFDVQVLTMSDQHITAKVTEIASSDVFLFTVGSYFTWNNKHDPSSRVFSRLDRFMINADWMNLYPECHAYFLPEVEVAKIRLSDLQNLMHKDPTNLAVLEEESAAAVEYRTLSKAHYSFLSQKSKIGWLCEGDENTKYFHNQIKAKQMHNKILQIKDKNGQQHTDPLSIEKAFLDYYMELLGDSKDTLDVHVPTVTTGSLISEQHRSILLKPVSPQEVKDCIFSIPSTISPGPDGFSSQFYRDSWDIIGKDITGAVLDFFATGKLLRQVNSTILTLIPKVKQPGSVLEYRPIACCNVLYRCITKIICSRLSEVLPDIMHSSQGGFIKGRNIVDNVLICQDLVRMYNRKVTSPRTLIKIDLRKAYDTVEWKFIHQMLHALKFPPKFIHLVMICITSPTYCLNVNGNTFGFFPGKRGLRQGDPMSPLIFTVYGLSLEDSCYCWPARGV
ncbi:uncharacterized protein LOC141617406 [Silene latifolia]|uniref:uncharacterized protein LOC141617406 n=1 Tax=Silene latifolia TaxID=37657 RepID=UPI003D77F087